MHKPFEAVLTLGAMVYLMRAELSKRYDPVMEMHC